MIDIEAAGLQLSFPALNGCRVFTPEAIARAMVCRIKKREGFWLEPSCGDGVFLRSLAKEGVAKERIRGIELRDECHPDHALGMTSTGVDFLRWSQRTNERFDYVIGNPPYISVSKLPEELRLTYNALVTGYTERLSGTGNYWVAFVLNSLKVLRPGGSLAFVLPASWEYADYAVYVRQRIMREFASCEVHRCHEPLCHGVEEAPVVLIAEGFQLPAKEFGRVVHEDVASLLTALINRGQLKPHSYARERVDNIGFSKRLGDVIDVKIGAVTGDAGFFLLTESEREGRDLPIKVVTPCLSRSKHLIAPVIDKEQWQSLLELDERVWLFSPTEEQSLIPQVAKVLTGRMQRAFGRKMRERTPWFQVPFETGFDCVLSGMASPRPWLALCEWDQLAASNTLYVGKFKLACSFEERCGWALAFLTSTVNDELRKSARWYAGGLRKYEPSDITRLQLPIPNPAANNSARYREAVNLLLAGRVAEASEIADSTFRL